MLLVQFFLKYAYKLPHRFYIVLFVKLHKYFMHYMLQRNPKTKVFISDNSVILWKIRFANTLCNSAGLFKNGEGYNLVSNQGAGAYIGGTSTYEPRIGNTKCDIHLPMLSFFEQKISINNLGLPNAGDAVLSRLSFDKVDSCPVGWSVYSNSDLYCLVESLFLYHDNPFIDFLELNESCPNIDNKDSEYSIEYKLSYLQKNFLSQRKRNLPLIVKLSNDITCDELDVIVPLLIKYGFDGVNIGNTTTQYHKVNLDVEQLSLFEYFYKNIGGGVGGVHLKYNSLKLCKYAVDIVRSSDIKHEFSCYSLWWY